MDRSDILSADEYAIVRDEKRAVFRLRKQLRRAYVGPYATFYFENYETMWLQVQEMLRIEQGGEDQIIQELEAYNPLIPKGNELVATMMLEIESPVLRDKELRRLGEIENFVYILLGEKQIKARPELDQQRTDEDGRTSSVHFFHFQFDKEDIINFKDHTIEAFLQIKHPEYSHSTTFRDNVRNELAKDFD